MSRPSGTHGKLGPPPHKFLVNDATEGCGRQVAQPGSSRMRDLLGLRLPAPRPADQERSIMLDIARKQGIAPFDTTRLDRLMDEAGMDVLVATSKHNVQYLLGGHRAFFFESMDAMGLSRYLPVFVYQKGAPEKAGFFGHRMEGFQNEVKPFWVS